MTLSFGFLQFFGVCRHPHTYRERRELHGLRVLHFVCEDCGHAVPVLHRTAEEHQRAVETGAVRPADVRHLPTGMVTLGKRRRSARSAAVTSGTRRVTLATSDGVPVTGARRATAVAARDDRDQPCRKIM
jgi:hypothetical protein